VKTRRVIAVALAAMAAAVIAACGNDSPRSAVADAGASLGRVHSGVMHLTMELATAPNDPTARVGFQLDGAFDLASNSPLPLADLTVTNLSDPSAPTTHFLSTGTAAYIVEDGVGYQLDDSQTARLRQDTTSNGSRTLSGLDLAGWVVDPVTQPVASSDGGEGERITGSVDPVAALNGIASLAGQLGAGEQTSVRVADNEKDRVRAAVKSSSFEVITGGSDHLLRSLHATVEFGAPAAAAGSESAAVLDALQRVGRVTLTIALRLDGANAPVSVQAPSTVKPFSDLSR
jgi:hypothetical protein